MTHRSRDDRSRDDRSRDDGDDLAKALTSQNATALFILSLALIFGVIGFGVIILFLYFRPGTAGQSTGEDSSLLTILSAVNAFLFLTLFPLSIALFGKITDSGIRRWLAGEPVHEVGRALRTAVILRGALGEGPALLGLVVCLLAVISGTLHEQPLYAFNATSTIAFVLLGLAQLPTPNRIQNLLGDRCENIRLRR